MKLMKWSVLAVISVSLLTACGSGGSKVSLSGAGATFPAPFYNDATKQYGEISGLRVSYGATGSGAGIRNLQDLTVDFGGTDVFLSDEEMKRMSGEVLHIPTCIGGVVMGYNLPGVTELNLSPTLVTKMYMGEISNWNDPQIAAVNPGVTFPDQAITPVYRSEGSGTTAVFSGFMSAVDSVWAATFGAGKSIDFTNGIAAKGNPGVAGVINETVGSIGYLGSEYTLALNIPSAKMLNSAGNYVDANMESISLSGDVADMPDDTRKVISNSANPNAYPISTFTWLITYKEQSYNNRSVAQAKALQNFLLYLVGDEGAESASKTHFSPLPAAARAKAEAAINSMTYGGALLKDLGIE
ncbi:phosphate ABC transporter substrate-binding protein PstS [Porphyromonas levii]|uniref:phosphate ABC transporter substrate-binding protein PstS n=1 Tax=Porphyromonas levii TaxID=28114 RepID=UPI001E001927|nr:Phosphate-binding protein PstS [Porphyromonas levii]MBR8712603.1 Phosphate-binding protein PstS [Porphyromonas levii]MBR8714595.1 Phosphate-binding protein PstS [Porphyromonas levii]MBR8727124.1 Phosphate-binding protein PstS [Porphyromonas levii]MBR8735535.1 Phosphate-binding protein PstS [Porphyromonas levii]